MCNRVSISEKYRQMELSWLQSDFDLYTVFQHVDKEEWSLARLANVFFRPW